MSPWLLHQRTADHLKPLVSTPQWIWTVATALRGIAARKLRHIRPHRNFMLSDAPVCLPSSCLSSIMIVLINEWWIITYQSSIISPWLLLCNCWSFVLVERWRTAAFSQFCLQIALPYKKGNRKLIVPWSSFNTHRTTDNARACLLSH